MDGLGDRLLGLLEGDFVRLETTEQSVPAEVVTNEVARLDDPAVEPDGGHTVSFMPIGEAATDVVADRLHVTLEPDDDSWRVGTVMADVFDESALAYVSEPWGELVAVEPLELRE